MRLSTKPKQKERKWEEKKETNKPYQTNETTKITLNIPKPKKTRTYGNSICTALFRH